MAGRAKPDPPADTMLTAMSEPAIPNLTTAVDEFAANNFSPSGIVAVARGGAVLQSLTWGNDGYDVTTPFRIASLTKSFTALALLTLRRAGLLSLDDEVRRHLPELKLEAPSDWPTLRIRHLIAMSGGLATDNPWGDRQESRTREELAAWLVGGLRLTFPPGSAFEYSNLGYALLGEVIARASGQEYQQFVRQNIIDPLGLRDTRFAAEELASSAQGYHREPMLPGQGGGWTAQTASGPGAFSPIGGLYSSVRDLVAWAQLYLGREAPAGADFTAADLREAQQPLTHFVAAPAEAPLRGLMTRAYGYGLSVETYPEHGTLIAHAGGYPGFTAYMIWHLESGHAVIASANGTHSAVPGLARRVMLPIVAGAGRPSAPVEPWPETISAAQAIERLVKEAQATDATELMRRYAGIFAENVELDFPLSRRIEYLRQGLLSLGALRPKGETPELTTDRPASAHWSLPTEYGRLELYIELAPVAPYGVQTFSAEVVSGAGRVQLF